VSKVHVLFADSAIELTEEHAEPLLQLGPLPVATVVLFPHIAQSLEVRGPDDTALYRHPDYWPSFQVARNGAPPVPRTDQAPPTGESSGA
jgi:hypothetical protein